MRLFMYVDWYGMQCIMHMNFYKTSVIAWYQISDSQSIKIVCNRIYRNNTDHTSQIL